jgi:hypothetical protein
MNWFYAIGGQQQGPVDDGQLDALAAAGTITPETLVWREGLANWQPLRQARPASGGAPPVVAPPVAAPAGAAQPLGADEIQCVECGNRFPKDSAMQYGAAWICAGCKPRFVQKLREGAATGGALTAQTGVYVDPETLVSQAIARGPDVEIGACIGRAWELMKNNFWLLVGASFVNVICQWAAGSIPLLGYCTGPVLQGPLLGGLYLLFLKMSLGQEGTFGDAFSGFSNFLQLMLASVVSTLLIVIWFVPGGVCLIIGIGNDNTTLQVVGGGLILLGVPFAFYLSVSWIFSYLLMMDRKYDFWTAFNVSRKVVNKCWWAMFGLLIVLWLIQIVGLLALCLGFFVTMSVMYGAIAYAYDDIFHGKTASA